MDSLNPVTREGLAISSLFWFVLALSAAVLLVVLVPLVYSIVRFREPRGAQRSVGGHAGEDDPPQADGNLPIEVIWTAGALVLVAVLFGGAVLTMRTVNEPDASAMQVQVIGHQWWWEFQYPDLHLVTADELHLPTGSTSRLELTSRDVIHSFWVPQLGWKEDATPGRTTEMTVRMDRTGILEGVCAEYCGVEHAWMRVRVVAQSQADFDAWVQQQQQVAATPLTDAERHGQQVLLANACVGCHTIQGTPAMGRVGPDLTHIGSRATIAGGVLDNTPENLRAWIKHAKSIEPGVLMPNFDSLSDADAAAIATYLQGLK